MRKKSDEFFAESNLAEILMERFMEAAEAYYREEHSQKTKRGIALSKERARLKAEAEAQEK